MPRRPTQEQLFRELQDRYGPEIANAFMAAINDLKTAADVQRVIAALEAGNIDAAITALHLDRAAFGPLLDAVQGSYTAGGQAVVSALPTLKDAVGAAVVIRFDGRNLRAEAWLRDHSAELVTRILDDQRAAVRTAMESGMQRGENPRATALDIVGRLDRATGKREGGILGLSAPQEQYVASARTELASGDPKALANYLTRTRRDKRFDRTIRKAIETEGTVPADIQRKALNAYQSSLLKLRGETIGRTEALTSLNAAQHEGLRQAVDSGAIRADQVRRVWSSAGDERVRGTHAGLNGETVGLDEAFTSSSGAQMLYPGDTSRGAPASEIINCRCVATSRIDFLANIH